MVFSFFGRITRRAASAPSRAQVSRDSTGSGAYGLTTIADALPEVNEGSGDEDWAAWDAAMAMLENRLQALHAADLAHLRAEMKAQALRDDRIMLVNPRADCFLPSAALRPKMTTARKASNTR